MDEEGRLSSKYNCRQCPIRERCIESSDNSPAIKDTISNSFLNKTDTLVVWQHLLTNCLLEKADREVKEARQESLLSRRLRSIREAKESPLPEAPVVKPVDPPIIPAERLKPTYSTPASMPVERPAEIRDPGQVTQSDILRSRATGNRYWLVVKRSGRRISLPVDGELVLGRFDPNFGIPPDVDLTFEDGTAPSISRRHARIEGKGSLHTIQEMGSKLGVIINGKPISIGKPQRLFTNDVVKLGNCEMVYSAVPPWILCFNPAVRVEHWLILANTGQRVRIPSGKEFVIGRSDTYVNFMPDLDLSVLKLVAGKVSRRHAMLMTKPGQQTLYIEDMGSGFGTKINGQLIMLGKTYPLTPGDHIWLGGCVLAYDAVLR